MLPVCKGAPDSAKTGPVHYFALMIKAIFVLTFLTFSLAGLSQSNDTAVNTNQTIADSVSATFPGGEPAWQMFLNKNLRFPEELVNKIRGRKSRQWDVIITFMVTKEGKLR